MATIIDELNLKPGSQNGLVAKLEAYGKGRDLIAKTSRLDLYTATFLDILLDGYECSNVLELVEKLQKEHGIDAEQEVEKILEPYRNPQQMQWLFHLPKTPFGQVSFFLKDGSYIGRCRFYIPEGENIPHVRGSNSGNPQGLSPGYAEKSIHLLEKFTKKGYGPEGLKVLLNDIIKPVIGTQPLVYAGVNSEEGTPYLRSTTYPFLGLATTTGITNIPSLIANMKTGLVPARLVDSYSGGAGYPGYIDFRYPNPTDETEKLGALLQQWIEQMRSLGPEFINDPYVTTQEGMCSHGLKPEALIIYHKLIRQFSLGNPSSNDQLLAYQTYLNELFRSSIESVFTSTPPAIKELIWQYGAVDLREQILALPVVPQKIRPEI